MTTETAVKPPEPDTMPLRVVVEQVANAPAELTAPLRPTLPEQHVSERPDRANLYKAAAEEVSSITSTQMEDFSDIRGGFAAIRAALNRADDSFPTTPEAVNAKDQQIRAWAAGTVYMAEHHVSDPDVLADARRQLAEVHSTQQGVRPEANEVTSDELIAGTLAQLDADHDLADAKAVEIAARAEALMTRADEHQAPAKPEADDIITPSTGPAEEASAPGAPDAALEAFYGAQADHAEKGDGVLDPELARRAAPSALDVVPAEVAAPEPRAEGATEDDESFDALIAGSDYLRSVSQLDEDADIRRPLSRTQAIRTAVKHWFTKQSGAAPRHPRTEVHDAQHVLTTQFEDLEDRLRFQGAHGETRRDTLEQDMRRPVSAGLDRGQRLAVGVGAAAALVTAAGEAGNNMVEAFSSASDRPVAVRAAAVTAPLDANSPDIGRQVIGRLAEVAAITDAQRRPDWTGPTALEVSQAVDNQTGAEFTRVINPTDGSILDVAVEGGLGNVTERSYVVRVEHANGVPGAPIALTTTQQGLRPIPLSQSTIDPADFARAIAAMQAQATDEDDA